MSSIDDRIVRLEVQDSEFIKRLESDEKALKRLDETIGKVGDSKISDNIQKIADKFSNLGIVGVTAIQNIANKAVNAGEQLVKSLSVDNIASGWEKLQSQTKAVGTLSIQGYDMDEVNDVIEQLMWYSDETSYNFSDMLTSMTKFTAQGYGLREAMETLEGIANWSAVAGQNAAAGSSAMNALSKAIGRGYIQQQDWSSLQTLMMDNKQIRQMILDTAVEMGTLAKTSDTTYRSLSENIVSSLGASEFNIDQFATYLTTGKWLTSDVLVATMKKYSEAVKPVYDYVEKYGVSAADAIKALNGQLSEQALDFFAAAQEARSLEDALESVRVGSASTWQKTFNIIFGDYERQKEIWTDLSGYLYELFVESGNARNTLLKEWAAGGGADKIIEGFYNILDSIISVRDIFRQAWQNIFPPKTAKDLLNISEKFGEFTQKIKDFLGNAQNAEKIGRTLQGLFSILRLGKDVLQALLKPIANLFGSSGSLADSILTISQAVGDAVTNFTHWVEESEALSKVSDVLTKVLSTGWKVIKTIGTGVLYIISGIISKVSELNLSFENIGTTVVSVFAVPVKVITDFVKKLTSSKKEIDDDVISIERATEAAKNAAEDVDMNQELSVFQKLSNMFKDLGSSIKTAYDNYISPVFAKIKEFIGADLFSGGLIPSLWKILSLIISFKLTWGIGDFISGLLTGIAGLIRGLGSLGNILSGFAAKLKASAFLQFAIAIGLVVLAMDKLSGMSFTALTNQIFKLQTVVSAINDSINQISLSAAAGLYLISKINLWPLIFMCASFAAAIIALDYAGDKIKGFGEILASAFTDENLDKVFGFLQRFTTFLSGLSNAVTGLAIVGVANSITKLAKATKNWFTMTINVFKTDQSIAAKVKKFAVAIGLVTLSIYGMTKLIASNDKVWDAIAVIAGIAAVLELIGIAMSGFSHAFSDGANYGKEILKFTEGMGLVVLSIIALGNMDQTKLYRGLDAITQIGLGLAAVAAVFKVLDSKLSPIKEVSKDGKTVKDLSSALRSVSGIIIALSLGSLMLAGALMMLSYAGDGLGDAVGALTTIVATIGGLVALIAVASDGAKAGGAIFAAGLAFVGFAFAVNLMAGSLQSLSTVSSGLPDAAGALINLAIAMGVMLGVGAGIAKFTVGFGGFVEAIIAFAAELAGLWAVSEILPILAGGIEALNKGLVNFNTDAMWQIVIVFSVLGIVAGALAATIEANWPIVVGLVALLAYMAGLGGAVKILGDGLNSLGDGLIKLQNVRWPTLAKGAAVLAEIATLGALAGTLGLGVGGLLGSLGLAALSEAFSLFNGAFEKFCVIVDSYGSAVTKFFNDLADSILKLSDSIGSLLSNNGSGILGLLTGAATGGVGGTISTVLKGLGSGLDWLKGKLFGTKKELDDDVITIERATEAATNASTSVDQFGSSMTDLGSAIGITDDKMADLQTMMYMTMVDSANEIGAGYGENIAKALNFQPTEDAIARYFETSTTANKQQAADAAKLIIGEGIDVAKAKSIVGVEDIDKSMGEKMTELFSSPSSETNYAMMLWGQSNAETYAVSYADAAGKAMEIINEELGNQFRTDVDNYMSAFSDSKKVKDAGLALGRALDLYGPDPTNPFNIPGKSHDSKLDKLQQKYDERFGNINENMLSSSERMYKRLTDLFKGLNAEITTTANQLNDTGYSALGSGLSAINASEKQKELQDYELSLDQLVRKYATINRVYKDDGNYEDFWTYNGPMGGVIDEAKDIEWVYEGPTSGGYNAVTDKYYATVNDELISLDNWTDKMFDQYTINSTETIEAITDGSNEITETLNRQISNQSEYNSQIVTLMQSLGTKLDDTNTGINDFESYLGNLGVTLDSGELVGALTPKLNSALGTRQKLTERGVYK